MSDVLTVQYIISKCSHHSAIDNICSQYVAIAMGTHSNDCSVFWGVVTKLYPQGVNDGYDVVEKWISEEANLYGCSAPVNSKCKHTKKTCLYSMVFFSCWPVENIILSYSSFLLRTKVTNTYWWLQFFYF